MIKKILKPLPIAFVSFLILAKLFYRQATTADLIWFLKPISYGLEVCLNANFVHGSDGFYFDELNVLIDKSCSGFNLFLIYCALGSFCFLLKCKTFKQLITGTFLVVVISYLLTLLTNFCRIYTLLCFEKLLAHILTIQSATIHEALGIINNTIFLIIGYIIAKRLLKTKNNEKTAPSCQ
ncbi:MAG: exosortase K [Nonlabens sp.]